MMIKLLSDETWLICGGRDFSDQTMFDNAMSDISNKFGLPRKVVHGAARGADAMGAQWANRLALEVAAVPADWDKHGKAAGPIRNEQMLREHKPSRVIAFPGGAGTQDMIARAKKWGAQIIEVKSS
jgi:SLOG family YspA-like protein